MAYAPEVSVSRPVRLLATCAVVLVLGHLVGLIVRATWGVDPELGLVRQFDLNAEGNLAAWFSTFVLTCCAAVSLLSTTVLRLRQDPMSGRWRALTAVFLLMAVDETAQLHDMATGPIRNGLQLDFGILYFGWLIPALLLLAAGAIYFAPLVGSLSSVVRPRLIIAIAVYLSGAVGAEMVGGSVVENGRQSLSYLTVMTFEESLEMTGGLLLLHALLTRLHELRPQLGLRWTDAEPVVTEGSARTETAPRPSDA